MNKGQASQGEPSLPGLLNDDGPMLALAACGNHAAQAAMADHSIACGGIGMVPLATALAAAESFARMAAEGGDRAHRLKLSGVLLYQSQHFLNLALSDTAHAEGLSARSEIYQVEAVSIIGSLADEGDEYAAELLAVYGDAFSPKILKLADDLMRIESEAAASIDVPDTKH